MPTKSTSIEVPNGPNVAPAIESQVRRHVNEMTALGWEIVRKSDWQFVEDLVIIHFDWQKSPHAPS